MTTYQQVHDISKDFVLNKTGKSYLVPKDLEFTHSAQALLETYRRFPIIAKAKKAQWGKKWQSHLVQLETEANQDKKYWLNTMKKIEELGQS